MKNLLKVVVVGLLITHGLQAMKSVYAVESFEAKNIQKIEQGLK